MKIEETAYGLLEVYARPYNTQEPVVYVDEKSKQLLQQTRSPITLQPGRCAKQDYEYNRAGTRNIFVAVEPKGKRRFVEVTVRQTKSDLVAFVKHLLEKVYATALTVHLVLDNLNTHFWQTFVDVLGRPREGAPAATALLQRVEFHHTPKHASWLNLAEIEIGIMDQPCTGQRFATAPLLQTEVQQWQQRRNAEERGIEWKLTQQDADRKLSNPFYTLSCHYVSYLYCHCTSRPLTALESIPPQLRPRSPWRDGNLYSLMRPARFHAHPRRAPETPFWFRTSPRRKRSDVSLFFQAPRRPSLRPTAKVSPTI